MRLSRLARIAAEAEGLRLRGLARRTVTRIILAMIALMFLLGAIALAHVAAWYWLRTGLGQPFLGATGIMGGLDLLAAIVLGVVASRSVPGRIEAEALAVRRKAIGEMESTVSVIRALIPILWRLFDQRRPRG
jgi:hypothetical protein